MEKASEFFDAIKAGDVERVERMIEEDPSLLYCRDDGGTSPVLVAIYYGRRPVADRLIASGLKLDVFEGAAAGKLERVQQLVEADGSLANAFAPDGFQALGLAAFFGHLPVVSWLLAQGAEVNSASRNGMRVMPLHSAVAGGYLEIATALLAHGADANARQADAFAPLHGAAQNGQVEMVELLLSYGADKNAKSAQGQTPRDIALERRHEHVAALLE